METPIGICPNLADYTISFDPAIDSASIPAKGFEFWIAHVAMDFTGYEAIPDDGPICILSHLLDSLPALPRLSRSLWMLFIFTPGQ